LFVRSGTLMPQVNLFVNGPARPERVRADDTRISI
jgi:hypothetical protein